jgi:hypothetical protein
MDKKAFAALPQDLQNSLIRDYGNSGLTALKQLPATASAPYTQAGASQLKGQYLDPTMRENLQGVTYRDKQGNSFIALNPADTDQARTHAHEMEHVLANQGLGHGSQINKLWSQTVDDPSYSSRGNIVKRLVDHAPYLQEKWGLDPKDVEQGYEERTEPWNGACGVFHPMITEAVVRFQAETITETFPAQGPVRSKTHWQRNARDERDCGQRSKTT